MFMNVSFPTLIAGLSHRYGTTQDGYVFCLMEQANQIRLPTHIECDRLQGFPDNWTASQSDTQRYKQLGNAVTVNVTESIGQQLGRVSNG
jgi:DNA (cytosine-5)-methyltransferase 1